MIRDDYHDLFFNGNIISKNMIKENPTLGQLTGYKPVKKTESENNTESLNGNQSFNKIFLYLFN